MASREAARVVAKQVRPIMSVNRDEAKRRVLNLYKTWHRYIPYMVMDFHIPKTAEQCREKLREEFMKHSNVTDIRIMDMLVIKGQLELQETVNIWKQKGHIMRYWKDTEEPKPKDFLSKFIEGQ